MIGLFRRSPVTVLSKFQDRFPIRNVSPLETER